jgi:hypothetical protein
MFGILLVVIEGACFQEGRLLKEGNLVKCSTRKILKGREFGGEMFHKQLRDTV